MSVPAAYLAVIVIWSTTPLAIQWSGEGGGFLFGVASRMVLGALLCVALMGLLRVPLPMHWPAVRTYLASGLGIFGAMTCVYWGAQFIPSGWISVLFGLSPLVTGLFAMRWLDEPAFSPGRLLGLGFGFVGLVVMFGNTALAGSNAGLGMLAVLLSVTLHSLSAVLVKRVGADLPAMAVTGGGLTVAAPAYVLVWWLTGGGLPEQLPERALVSILYLALFGSVLGFIFYYYVLRHVEASRTSLITLITPVIALLLGAGLNDEVLTWRVWLGTGLILSGLLFYQGRGTWAVLAGRMRSS